MGKIEHTVGSCIEAWMLFMGSAWEGLAHQNFYIMKVLFRQQTWFVNKLSNYIQILEENVIVTVLLE